MSASPWFSARQLSARRGARLVVEGASFTAERGEKIAVIGPNGVGKSTLLRALAGLVPASGAVQAGASRLSSLPMSERARVCAYLPQEHVFHWPMPVHDVVALGRVPHGWHGGTLNSADSAAVAEALEAVHLQGFESRPVNQLSGGENARVALARALAVEAPLLLADEPVAALDPKHQQAAMQALSRRAAQGTLVLAVLHDLTLACQWASRILVLAEGRLVADGAPDEIMREDRLSAVFGVTMRIADSPFGKIVLPAQ